MERPRGMRRRSGLRSREAHQGPEHIGTDRRPEKRKRRLIPDLTVWILDSAVRRKYHVDRRTRNPTLINQED